MIPFSELSQPTLVKILAAVQEIVSVRGSITDEELASLLRKITKRNR
jgi:hypothetical protein